jgi:hypothetical protein
MEFHRLQPFKGEDTDETHDRTCHDSGGIAGMGRGLGPDGFQFQFRHRQPSQGARRTDGRTDRRGAGKRRPRGDERRVLQNRQRHAVRKLGRCAAQAGRDDVPDGGYASLDAEIVGPGGGRIGISEDSFNLSDIAFVPLQLNWNAGNFHFKLAEAIIAPTGDYDLDNAINLGRNYWSFDTAGAVTWFNPGSGTEVSVAPGIMFNTENNKTDYQTGTEFLVDFTINQFLSETFAVGLKGYYYKQVSGDSGSGATLGNFKSESVGLGPGFFWTPKSAGGRLMVMGKWLHDFDATNRFESEYGTLTVAWKF